MSLELAIVQEFQSSSVNGFVPVQCFELQFEPGLSGLVNRNRLQSGSHESDDFTILREVIGCRNLTSEHYINVISDISINWQQHPGTITIPS